MKTSTSITRTNCPVRFAGRLGTVCAARLLPLLLLALPAAAQAQFNYTTNNNAISIDKYTGSGGAVTIPSTIDGLPVTSIGDQAFMYCSSLTGVTIPNSVISIGNAAFFECTGLTRATIPNSVTSMGLQAFSYCSSLTNVTIGNGITSIGEGVFDSCTRLTSVTIPNNVTSIGRIAFSGCSRLTSLAIGNRVASIGDRAFSYCSSLTSVTIPSSVTSIGESAFSDCWNLAGVYFHGNAPSLGGSSPFNNAYSVTVYYVAGATGFGSTFGGRPTAVWKPQAPPQVQTGDAAFGVRTNCFGFNITATSGLVIVVEASTNPANATWSPLQTNTLSGDSFYFSDPQWTNYPARFYRLRSP